MDLDERGGAAAPSTAAPPTPDFPVYALAAWDGARVLERWSATGGRTTQVALGHGLRWDLNGDWCEVATFRPPAAADAGAGVRLEQQSTPLDRISMELDDLRTYGVRTGLDEAGAPARSPGRLTLDGTAHDVEVVAVRPVCSADVRLDSGSVVRVTWYGDAARDVPALAVVADLVPFLDGARRDAARRRELFEGLSR